MQANVVLETADQIELYARYLLKLSALVRQEQEEADAKRLDAQYRGGPPRNTLKQKSGDDARGTQFRRTYPVATSAAVAQSKSSATGR